VSSGKPAETQRCPYTAKQGDEVTAGSFRYNVTNVFTASFMGTGYTFKKPDGVFVILEMTVENSGKKSEYILSSNFRILDALDREYDVDSGASIYLSIMGVDPLLFDKLGPGLETKGNLVFDVPENDTGLTLEISEGLLSPTKKYIFLGDVADI
jgi:hypothetical protein